MPGATKVHVDAPQTYQAPSTPSGPASAAPGNATIIPGTCPLLSPTDDQVFMNTDTVSGRLQLGTPLGPGEHIVVLIDGSRTPVSDTSGAFTISPVDRGTHSMSAQVETADGQIRCQSSSITFHVRQPSTQSPTNPVKPH